MVTLRQVEAQLEHIGCKFRFVGRAEVKELPAILMQDEVIAGAVNGRYTGGGALLVVTNYRMLLIDRKPLFLTVEDIRFDMIAEIDFNARLLNSTAYIITPTRQLTFSSYSQQRLRDMLNYTQQKIMDTRQHYMQQQFTLGDATMGGTKVTAGHVGELALQGNRAGPMPPALSANPYTKTSLVMRRRHHPNFY